MFIEQEAKRNKALDIAKGIGILLVVLGHCPQCPNALKQWIYSFHMPLFFIISGFLWNQESHERRGYLTRKFILVKIQRLIIPCFLWGLLYTVVHSILTGSFSVKWIAYLMYGSQKAFSRAGSLTSLWFLPCMFLTVCIFEGLQKILSHVQKTAWLPFLISMLFFLFGVYLPRISVGYPWCADVAMLAAALMIWGFLIKDPVQKMMENIWLTFGVCLVCFVTLTVTYRYNLDYISINNVDMAGRHLGNSVIYLFDALCGSLFVILLSSLISRLSGINSLLSRFGRHTIPILVIHKPVIQKMAELLEKSVVQLIGVICSIVLSVLISEIVYLLLREKIPALYGEGRMHSS